MLHGAQHPRFLISLVLAPIFWGGNFVVGSNLAHDLPGLWTNFLRWLIALAVLCPFCAPAAWRYRSTLFRHWKRLAITALLGVTLFNTVLYIALQSASLSIAAVAFAVTPFMISGIQALIRREIPSGRFMAGAAFALFGMVLVQWDALSSGTPFIGIALVLLAALIWSFYCVSLKLCAVAVPCQASFLCQIAFGTLFMIPALMFIKAPMVRQIEAQTWVSLAYLGVFAAALAFWLWQRAIAAVGPARSSIFMNLVPISSVILGVIFLGTPIDGAEVAAFALVLFGIYLSSSRTTGRRASASTAAKRPVGDRELGRVRCG